MKAAKSVLCLNNLFIFQLNLVAFAADVYSRNDFPPGFVFEAATLAYQYEGASNEDGRTPSIWDTFTHAVGNMPGPSPDIACDGYHKYKVNIVMLSLKMFNSWLIQAWRPIDFPFHGQDLSHKAMTLDYFHLSDALFQDVLEATHQLNHIRQFTISYWLMQQQLMHPLVYGDYPSSMKKNAGSRLPTFTSLQSKQVKSSFDFLRLNFYFTMSVKDQPSSLEMEEKDVTADMELELIRPFWFKDGNENRNENENGNEGEWE
ncbi:hypothetical protein PTKIN_Ptkin03bG0087200 [Pterospermum kingtungense]